MEEANWRNGGFEGFGGFGEKKKKEKRKCLVIGYIAFL